MDLFSKFLHINPVKTTSGPSVASAFRSILGEPKYSRRKRFQIWVRNNKRKEFLNKPFQDKLRKDGIQFQVCRNTVLKCEVVERVLRTIRDRLYKYFTYKNTYNYRFLPKFVNAYNDTLTRQLAWRLGESRIRTFSRYVRGRRHGDGAFASRERRFAWGSTCVSARRRCGLPRLPN